MILNRVEFLNAITFLKPAIYDGEANGAFKYLHVLIRGNDCILTAGDGRNFKRVTLHRPIFIESMFEPLKDRGLNEADLEFLIDKNILESFETLCKKHRAKFSKAVKSDPSFGVIEILSRFLDSNGDEIKYHQSELKYTEIETLFMGQSLESSFHKIGIMPESALIIFKGFPGFDPLHVYVSGPQKPVLINQGDGSYQAVFLPVALED